MHPALKTFTCFLDALTDLVDGVRGNTDIRRPRFGAPGMAKKLKAGIRLIEVYLRRVLLVLALKLEPTLVDRPGVAKCSKRSVLCERAPVFRVLVNQYLSRHERAALREMARQRAHERRFQGRLAPRRIFMVGLYRRLDRLAAIAANPLKTARVLAYRIARHREGWIMAPDLRFRPPGCVRRLWRTETAMTFSALGYDINTSSKTRPPQLPPLPPREKAGGPRIRSLDDPKPWPAWLPGAQRLFV